MITYKELDKKDIMNMVAQLIITSINDTVFLEDSEVHNLLDMNIGGILLKNKSYNLRKLLNISSPKQLRRLIKDIKKKSKVKPFFAIDLYEDEKGIPLTNKNGFDLPILTPLNREKQGAFTTRNDYRKIIKEFDNLGIDLVFDVPLSCQKTGHPYAYSHKKTNVQLTAKTILRLVKEESRGINFCAKHFAYDTQKVNEQLNFIESFQKDNLDGYFLQVSHGIKSVAVNRLINRDTYLKKLRYEKGFSGLLISHDFTVSNLFKTDVFKEFFIVGLISGVNMFVISHEHKATLNDLNNVIYSIADDIIDDYDGVCSSYIKNTSDENVEEMLENPYQYFEEYNNCAYFYLLDSYNRIMSAKGYNN